MITSYITANLQVCNSEVSMLIFVILALILLVSAGILSSYWATKYYHLLRLIREVR